MSWKVNLFSTWNCLENLQRLMFCFSMYVAQLSSAFSVNTANFELNFIGIWNQTFRPGFAQWPPCLKIQRHATYTAVRDCLPLIFRLKCQKYSTLRSKPYFPTTRFCLYFCNYISTDARCHFRMRKLKCVSDPDGPVVYLLAYVYL